MKISFYGDTVRMKLFCPGVCAIFPVDKYSNSGVSNMLLPSYQQLAPCFRVARPKVQRTQHVPTMDAVNLVYVRYAVGNMQCQQLCWKKKVFTYMNRYKRNFSKEQEICCHGFSQLCCGLQHGTHFFCKVYLFTFWKMKYAELAIISSCLLCTLGCTHNYH